MVNGRTFALGVIGGAGVSVQLALAGRAVAWTGSAIGEASQSGIGLTPTWAKLIDFETTLPSAVEELARQRDERQRDERQRA